MDAGMVAVPPGRAVRALKIVLLLTVTAGTTQVRAADVTQTTFNGGYSGHLSADGFVATALDGAGNLAIWTSGGTSVFTGTSTAISADGSTVIGYDSQNKAIWISGGTVHTVDFLHSETKAIPTAISADGSVFVGYTTDNSDTYENAFIWTSATGHFVDLDRIDGEYVRANGISADGKVIVGTSLIGSDAYSTAVRWIVGPNGTTLQSLDQVDPHAQNPGYSHSDALGISADGSTIYGTFEDPNNLYAGEHAFRWTEANPVMEDLMPGGRSGYDAIPNGSSTDGSVIIGNLVQMNGRFDNIAFRWTQSSGAVELGKLTPGSITYANALSADGSVVVGTSDDGNDSTSHAFRWKADHIVSLDDLLTSAGVDLGGNRLSTADAVSADGTIVIGSARGPGHYGGAFYVANLDGVDANSGGGTPGVVTTDVIDASFASLGDPGANNNGHLGQVLDASGQFGPSRGEGPSGFAYGGGDTDPAAAGGAGLTAPIGGGLALGVVVDAGKLSEDLAYGGHSDFTSGSAVAFLTRSSSTGVQLYLGVGGNLFGGTITRGYLNGATPVSSSGTTSGYGYAGKGQIGFRVGDASDGVSLMPFVSGTYVATHIKGYAETGGPFPATVDPLDSSATQWRAGLEARLAAGNGFAVSASLTGVHGTLTTGGISGTVAGLLGVEQSAGTAVSDWLETGAGVTVPMGASADASLSVLARLPAHGVRSFAGQAGMRFAF